MSLADMPSKAGTDSFWDIWAALEARRMGLPLRRAIQSSCDDSMETEVFSSDADRGPPRSEAAGLTGISQTLLVPLWARAVETGRADGIIRDPHAVRILQELAFDFGRFDRGWQSQLGMSVRTWLLDREVSLYLARHPAGTVVLLGCGLDARALRLDNGTARWIELDLPEVMTLRERLLPPSARRRSIAASVLDTAWLDAVPADPPPLFVAEGLSMYIPEADLRALLSQIAERFPGSTMLIEALSRRKAGMTTRHDLVAKLGARFVFGIDSGREFEAWHEAIAFEAEWSYLAFQPQRWRYLRWLRALPFARRAIKIIRLRFGVRA